MAQKQVTKTVHFRLGPYANPNNFENLGIPDSPQYDPYKDHK